MKLSHKCTDGCAHTVVVETAVCLMEIRDGWRILGWCDRLRGHDGDHSFGVTPAPGVPER